MRILAGSLIFLLLVLASLLIDVYDLEEHCSYTFECQDQFPEDHNSALGDYSIIP